MSRINRDENGKFIISENLKVVIDSIREHLLDIEDIYEPSRNVFTKPIIGGEFIDIILDLDAKYILNFPTILFENTGGISVCPQYLIEINESNLDNIITCIDIFEKYGRFEEYLIKQGTVIEFPRNN